MKMLRSILIALVLAWLATGLARVKPEERAVVRRFGEVVARPQPGLWIGLPWGIDRIDRVSMSARQLAVGYEPEEGGGQFLTGDQNLVNARVVLEYSIDEAKLDVYLLNRDVVEAVLAREAEGLVAEWAAGRGVDDALLAGRAELPAWLAKRLPARIDACGLGLVLQRASVEHLAAPSEVRDAFEAVNQAQAAIRTREMLARREADQRRQQAETLKHSWEQQALAYRTEKISAATADAATFTKRLEQYRQAKATNPDALAAIWWDEMGRTLLALRGRGRLDVLDAHLGKDGLDLTQFLAPRKP